MARGRSLAMFLVLTLTANAFCLPASGFRRRRGIADNQLQESATAVAAKGSKEISKNLTSADDSKTSSTTTRSIDVDKSDDDDDDDDDFGNSTLNSPLPSGGSSNVFNDESAFAACEASKMGDRCADDQSVVKHHVTFDMENNNYASECDPSCYAAGPKRLTRKGSVELEDGDVTGEDLGFEEGDVEECMCDPCRRLATWDELAGVAIPLMERLRPSRTDASVGTK